MISIVKNISLANLNNNKTIVITFIGITHYHLYIIMKDHCYPDTKHYIYHVYLST